MSRLLSFSSVSSFSRALRFALTSKTGNADLSLVNPSLNRNLMSGKVLLTDDDKSQKMEKQPLKKPRKTRASKKLTEEIDNTKFKGSNVLKPFPNNTNPSTGEVGGPRGPEPTRFGDWERKGRVSDF